MIRLSFLIVLYTSRQMNRVKFTAAIKAYIHRFKNLKQKSFNCNVNSFF
jgi:hypothetical protein